MAAKAPPLADDIPKDSTPTPEQPPSSKLPCSERQIIGLEQATTFAVGEGTCYQPKSQVTRTGRVTQVPVKFKDWMEIYMRRKLCFFFVDFGFLFTTTKLSLGSCCCLIDTGLIWLLMIVMFCPLSIFFIALSKRGGCHIISSVTCHIWIFAPFFHWVILCALIKNIIYLLWSKHLFSETYALTNTIFWWTFCFQFPDAIRYV